MIGLIRRTKSSPINADKPEAGQTTRVHYATRIDPSGIVTGWAEDRGAAVEVDRATADVVLKKAAGPNAGLYEYLTGPALKYAKK